jgi:hypothetical protein
MGSNTYVKVEEGVDLINIKLGEKVVYSMRVTDDNASRAFGALKSAINSAKKSAMPNVEEPKVIVDELHAERVERVRTWKSDMTDDQFKKELDMLAEAANERIIEHVGKDKLQDHVIYFLYDGDDTIVRSGITCLATLHGHSSGAVKKAKSVVWPMVDGLRVKSSKIEKKENPDCRHDRGGLFSDRLKDEVDAANKKLSEIGEANLAVETDSAGFYLLHGKIPVFSVAKGVGSADEALDRARARIWEYVNGVRGVVDRRKNNEKRASEVEADSSWSVEILKKANPSIEDSEAWNVAVKDGEVWKFGPNPDAAAVIVEAAKKAKNAFNAQIRFKFDSIEDCIGDGNKRMKVSGYMRGVVVSFGNDPCFISTFPVVGNNSTVEEAAAYVERTLSAIGESRIKFYESICAEMSRQKKLRDMAAKRDSINKEMESINKEIESMAM